MKTIAHVLTDRPGRYGKQMASHFAKKCETAWDAEEETGFIAFAPSERNNFTSARVDMRASEVEGGAAALVLSLDAPEESVEALEMVVARHLVAFGRKDDLRVEWVREGGAPGLHFGVGDLPEDRHGA